MKKNLTGKFVILQTLYYSAYCGMITYAVTYLLDKGFKASEAGTVLFCANVLSFILQPFVANKADKASKNVLPKYIIIQGLISLSAFILVMFLDLPKLLLGAVYFIGVALFDMEQPLLNAIVIYYEDRGFKTNYGYGRAAGTIGFGIASVLFGNLIQKSGVDVILPISLSLVVFFIIYTVTYPKTSSKANSKEEVISCSLSQFFSKYKWYVASLFGLLLLSMVHLMLENYLIEIFTTLGGDSSNVGIALLVATIPEAIVLLVISQLVGKVGTKKLLLIGGISYIIKASLFVVSKSIWLVYFAELFQATSYTFVSPVQLFYARQCTNAEDMVKGQSMSTAFWAMGCGFGNLLGGVLITAFSLKTMLLSTIAISILGTAMFIITVPKALKQ